MSGDHNQHQKPDYIDRRQWKYDPMTGVPYPDNFIDALKYHTAKYSDIVSDGGLDPRNKFDATPPQRDFKFSTIDEAKQPMPTPAGRPQLTDDESRFADAFTALLKAGYGKEAEIILKCKPAWQGLTKTEVKVLWRASNNQAEFASLLEAKLKERNI